MTYLDFDLEIGKSNDGIYPVQAHWQGNEANHVSSFAREDDPISMRKQIEDAVLDSPLKRRRAFAANEAVVQRLGQKLFDFALNGEVLAQLRACQRAVKSQGRDGVRLRLRILDPQLSALPWEYLYDTRLRDFIALDPTFPLVRYLRHAYAAPPLQVTPPLRILAMVCSPINLPALDVEAEKQRVNDALRALQSAGRVELVWLEGEGSLDLQSALRKGPWHIFHFIGHGDFDAQRDEGYLVVCSPRNRQREPLYATQLARLLAAQNTNLRFVLLNACESGRGSATDIFSSTGETLINRDIPAVLAMQYSISDEAATLFAQKLYESIADGLPVDRSVAEARNALALADSQNLEWGVPVLHMRAPDGRLFDMGSAEYGVRSAELSTTVKVEAPVVTIPTPKPEADYAAIIAQMQARLEEQDRKLVEFRKPLEPVPTPTILKRSPIDFDWVTIPAGEFWMGSDKAKDKDAFDDEMPQHKLHLPSYKIARIPVTVAQFEQFVKATKYKTTAEEQGSAWNLAEKDGKWQYVEIKGAYWAAPRGASSDVKQKANHPVTCVSWPDAQAFCNWAEVRLPSEAEWERAARGTEGRIYPWGNQTPDATLCNFNMNVKDTTAVGNYPKGASGEGLLDMAGNVWEWTINLWGNDGSKPEFGYPYVVGDRRENLRAGDDIRRVVRGGSFNYNLRVVRCASRSWLSPRERLNDSGLRVVAPGS